MKFKSKSKDSKSHGRSSKAVDVHLEEEIQVWAGDSFTSIASSVTAPPSQTASFYKKVLGNYRDDNNFDFEDSDDDDDSSNVSENHTNRSSDDSLSFADTRSRCSSDDGGDSMKAVKKPSKKDKQKKVQRKGRRRFFGGTGTIEEDQDAEEEEAPQTGRRARRLSLFGNSESNHEVSRQSGTDAELSVNQSDDGGNLSNDGNNNDDLGYGDGAPTVSRTKPKRRGSLGGMFSKKQENNKGGGRSDDGSYATRSQDGSTEELGYEDAAPTVSRSKPKRRGSLGGMFSKNQESNKAGGRSDDGSYATRSQDGSNDGLGYEDAAPTVSRSKPKRRGSLGGMFSKNQESKGGGKNDDGSHATRSQDGSNDGLGYEDAAPSVSRSKPKRRGSLGGLFSKNNPETDSAAQLGGQNRGRRNSLSGFNAPSERTMSSKNDKSMVSASNHTTKSQTKSNRRRNSLTGSNYKGNSSSQAMSPAKEIHWIVNQERKARGMPLFERNGMLDALAKSMSNEMAVGLPPSPTEYYGNVGRGESLQKIHVTIMEDRSGISRKNILSTKFTEFGMALTQGNDGNYYMVTLFKQ